MSEVLIVRRGQRISKGGGRDFKCCCVQENFEKLTLSGAFSDHFLRKGGGARDRRPPPLTAYARGIGLVQVILVLSFFHFCLKLSFVKSNRIILTETHVHKIPPPSQKFDQYINNCYYLYPLVSKHDYITLMPIEYCILLLLSMVVLFRKGQ